MNTIAPPVAEHPRAWVTTRVVALEELRRAASLTELRAKLLAREAREQPLGP